MGELAVSRAIGDHCLRPYVIPEPEVSMIERTRDDEVLVMASDGLWDVINNQEAAEMALHTLQVCAHGSQSVLCIGSHSYVLVPMLGCCTKPIACPTASM